VLSRVHWVRPELVTEVKFFTWTDDNLLRQKRRSEAAGARWRDLERHLVDGQRLQAAPQPWRGVAGGISWRVELM
jgi:ATP-dependent DNA ligase